MSTEVVCLLGRKTALAQDFGLKPRTPNRTPSRDGGLRQAKAHFCQGGDQVLPA